MPPSVPADFGVRHPFNDIHPSSLGKQAINDSSIDGAVPQWMEEVDALVKNFSEEVKELVSFHMHPSVTQQSNGLAFRDGWKEETLVEDEHPNSQRPAFTSQGSMESLVGSSWGAMVTSTSPQSEGAPVTKRNSLDGIVKEAAAIPITADECLFDIARERLLRDQTWLQKFTRSQKYEILSGTLIFFNTLFIGVQTEYTALKVRDKGLAGQDEIVTEEPPFLYLSAIFTVLFTVEFGVRWVSEGFFGLFRTNDASWFLFDMAIITLSWVDSFVSLMYLATEKGGQEHFLSRISVLRILRVARIVKLARVIRLMAFFRELRLMVYSIFGSMKSLIWLALILGNTFYIFGITFTSGIVSHITPEVLWTHDDLLGVRECFGTLGRSLLSLYMAMAGGRSWGEYYFFLDGHLPPQYPVMFLVFLTFTIFAVLNIVTGVFVELAMKANFNSRQVVINEELDNKKEFLRDLRNLFHEMDENGDGSLSYEEFRHRLSDEHVIAYFKALGLDVHDTRALFNLLDVDGSQEVDILEFLNGCWQLQGEARSIDTKMIRLTLNRISHQMEVLQFAQDEQKAGLSSVAKRLHRTNNRLRSSAAGSKNGTTLASYANGTDPATVADSEDPSVNRVQVIASKPQQRANMLDGMRRDREKDAFQGDAWDAHLHQILAGDYSMRGTPKMM